MRGSRETFSYKRPQVCKLWRAFVKSQGRPQLRTSVRIATAPLPLTSAR